MFKLFGFEIKLSNKYAIVIGGRKVAYLVTVNRGYKDIVAKLVAKRSLKY